jgi:hypothetical protein
MLLRFLLLLLKASRTYLARLTPVCSYLARFLDIILTVIIATQGGGGISPTFGAALWILDYVMQTVLMGTDALYFHQGTVGNCKYSIRFLIEVCIF